MYVSTFAKFIFTTSDTVVLFHSRRFYFRVEKFLSVSFLREKFDRGRENFIKNNRILMSVSNIRVICASFCSWVCDTDFVSLSNNT